MKNPAMIWREECEYIQAAFDNRELENFHNDLAVFVTYCKMQKRRAEQDGFNDTAQYIQHIIDDAEQAQEVSR